MNMKVMIDERTTPALSIFPKKYLYSLRRSNFMLMVFLFFFENKGVGVL